MTSTKAATTSWTKSRPLWVLAGWILLIAYLCQSLLLFWIHSGLVSSSSHAGDNHHPHETKMNYYHDMSRPNQVRRKPKPPSEHGTVDSHGLVPPPSKQEDVESTVVTISQQEQQQEEPRKETDQITEPVSGTSSSSSNTDNRMILNGTPYPAPTSPYAYAFVLGGIREDQPAYKGFLYNILIATRILRRLGSTADVWIWTQVSPESNRTSLPEQDVEWLTALNIRIQELEQPAHESFAQVVYSKFRLLQMTMYQRVLFLDADIVPLVNLDYWFHLSVQGILRPNVMVATRGEPCNTGVFLVQPLPGDWESWQAAVHAQHEAGKLLPYPHFDWKLGWGYHFQKEQDYWEAVLKNGTTWRFHAGHSDQGTFRVW